MQFQYILYEKRGRVAYITLNRPEVMNALHSAASAELYDAWDDLEGDSDVRVAVITGTGDRAFCAGNDLKYAADHPSEIGHPVDKGGFGAITQRYKPLTKPIIAAVNGYALGGGFEVALASDIIVAAEHAQFGLTEPKWGRVAGTGIQRLPRQIPLKIAMGLILTGGRISAQDALEAGLANEVVPLADLVSAADRWAAQIVECAPLAVQACKQAIMMGADLPLETALARRYPLHERVGLSMDRAEGAKAFSEKRRPVWQGR
tara:strand:+ start:1054 stop:1836 length:783 start_codon:yes stop_codon:yes gene_type:complete